MARLCQAQATSESGSVTAFNARELRTRWVTQRSIESSRMVTTAAIASS